jgi:glycerophosphoryl diester phosphodiesterase
VSRPSTMPRWLTTPVLLALAALLAVAFLTLREAPATKPSSTAPPAAVSLAKPDVDVVAHRGSSGVAPENTLAALRVALDQRAPWFEFDVQRTSDGELVMMHDADLLRTTNVEDVFPDRQSDPIGSFTLAELQQLDAGTWFAPEYAGEPIPTLDEVIDVAGLRIGFLLEVKDPALYPGIEQDILDAFNARPDYFEAALRKGKLVLQSFDHESMRRLDELDPRVPTGLLTSERMTPEQLEDVAPWADQINPSFQVTDQSFVDEVHALDMEILVWTVDAGRDAFAVLARDVDGVITNYPIVISDILRRR